MLSTMRSVAAVTLALSALSVQTVSSAIVAGPVTDAGCFNAAAGLEDNGTFNYQSKGHCQQTCIGVGATVMAMTDGDDCWCGSTLPAKSSLQSDDSKCSKACVGYPSDICGADGYWSVYYTTTDTDIDYFGGSSSSGSSSSSSSSSSTSKSSAASSASSAASSMITSTTSASPTSPKATVITSIAPGTTVVITQVPTSQASKSADNDQAKKGGSNTAGIAAGVVVGIVGIAALFGAAFFFWRRKQRREAESGHQQLNDYSSPSSQKPMSFRPSAGPDSRIDPDAMAQRRMSDGSIADNEDYSRRILKVTNA
ncbi:WSC-domain-containing protein [Aureobasidium sp. EXF-10728]|nr:WSC-domain-containing protein [Aureobasidium sp. EXF-10728]